MTASDSEQPRHRVNHDLIMNYEQPEKMRRTREKKLESCVLYVFI